MASTEETRAIPLTSYETALCVVPPSHLTGDIDRLRALYDKAHGRWPPHANLIYPFVAPEALPQASKLLQSVLSNRREVDPIRLRLDKSDFFAHKRSNTVYLTDSGSDGLKALAQLQHDITDAFGGQSRSSGRLHLTVGQSEADDLAERQFLLEKVGLIPAVEWEVEELVILIRDRSQGLDTASSPMVVWGAVSLSGTPSPNPKALEYLSPSSLPARSETTFQFSPSQDDSEEGKWNAIPKSPAPTGGKLVDSPVTVASYNVLVESLHPPPTERYPLLLQNLLSDAASADILILQEVADDFLSFLLRDKKIRLRYPFATHGPPDQAEIGPLNSLRNIVVLSRWQFRWEWLPFDKRHKGAVVLQLEHLGTFHDSKFLPLVVTGVHLSCGLIDSSIMAKRSQLQTVLKYLSGIYPNNHWVVAGDFNITTSSYTIDTALKRKSISAQGASVLASLDGMLTDAGLLDCYYASRAASSGLGNPQGRLDLGASYEGEEGATYDPTENEHAARIAGQSFHSRPQRYDRILVRGVEFEVLSYNLFGIPSGDESQLASDHWGVRATVKLNGPRSGGLESEKAPITVEKAPLNLGGIDGLKECLKGYLAFPSNEEITQRQEAFELIKELVNRRDANLPAGTRLDLLFEVVPVGSYGFGVWNSSSDMDILVIGQVSPRTFFALMIAKLRRATDSDVVLLRKVKAASGIMLELEVRGVRVDLQYCAATRVVESWPQALELPADHSTFDLPMQSLLKLNSLRDMHYLQRTIPDLASFRLAYRFIKIWAQRRGIYSSKLGYLGGIHITLLLARICTLSFRQAGTISAADIITTFFKHYAQFNWEKQVVYDPSFYKSPPRYFRPQREPLVILSQHQPKVNVARAASIPSTRTLVQEFQRADKLLSQQDVTWEQLAGSIENSTGADEFLKSYRSYAKVNVQYWGGAATKGRLLVGWLEWRCVSLLVDIHRKFPDIHARIWPARFTDMEEVGETTKEYQGCYLIGLTRESTPGATPLSDADRQSAQISLLAVLNSFAEQIREDENYFDSSSSWVDVSLVQPSALSGLRVDISNWGNGAYDEASFDDDEDEIELEDEEDEELVQARLRTMPIRGTKAVAMPEGAKLRSASDVLNRLRWDAEFDIENYIVGYDDRFLGEREMPAGQWKADLTDEAFIPMHRILYFKRKSDGVKVWDRETRTDLLFGSGVSSKVQE
ncbi:poly(A) polymerase pla1 [Aspergillus flavus]|nr:poly(A) polymerase pla1 [Aspergillus flavus]RAQ79847.1 poly(A) polymerase pla1 [Aspergillus flavus]